MWAASNALREQAVHWLRVSLQQLLGPDTQKAVCVTTTSMALYKHDISIRLW